MKNFRNKFIKWLSRIIAFFKIDKSKKVTNASYIIPSNNPIIIDKKTNPLDVDLVDDNISNKDKKELRQHTKFIVDLLTAMACIWISCSYIYAGVALFKYGNTEFLQTLSEQVCITVLGVVVSYCLKSFIETYCQKKNELDFAKMNLNDTITNNINSDSEDGGVG